MGPLAIASIALMLLLDLLASALLDGRSSRETVLIGLIFGQVGAVVVWYFARGPHRWWRIAIVLGVAGALSVILGWGISSADMDEIAMLAVIVYAFVALSFGGCLAIDWFRHQRMQSNGNQADSNTPRFGVKHLLVLTTLLALASLVVRFALPELRSVNYGTVITWDIQSALLAIVAYALTRQRIAFYWRVAALVPVAAAGTLFMNAANNWDEAAYANAIQVAMLAIALVVMNLERYDIRIAVAPRGQGKSQQTTEPSVD